MNNITSLHTAVINSLEDQIAVIDRTGNIIDVNSAWNEFGLENGLPAIYACVGRNYLKTLTDSYAAGDSLAGEALQGILEVLHGKCAFFYFEYPCHSPDEQRWFMMRVIPLKEYAASGLFVISHHNITQRKLAEQRVELLAMQDPLTGLANRRSFNLFLNRELRNNIRNRSPISLVLIDVDNFKGYNDDLGHIAGDKCLINIGQTLQAQTRRPADLAARLGGDEFALILGNTDLAMAQKVTAAILATINDLKMIFAASMQVTTSMGLVSMVPDEEQDEESLFQQADKALYRAKSAGRNRIVYVQPPTKH